MFLSQKALLSLRICSRAGDLRNSRVICFRRLCQTDFFLIEILIKVALSIKWIVCSHHNLQASIKIKVSPLWIQIELEQPSEIRFSKMNWIDNSKENKRSPLHHSSSKCCRILADSLINPNAMNIFNIRREIRSNCLKSLV